MGARHILCGALQQAPNVSREANSKSLSDPIHYVGPETLVWVGSQPPFPFLLPEWCSHLPPLLGTECRHGGGGGGRCVFSWRRSSVYLYSRGRLKLDTGTHVIVYADVTLATPAPTQIQNPLRVGRRIKLSVCIPHAYSRLATTQYLIRFMLDSPVGDDPVPRRVYPAVKHGVAPPHSYT